MEMLFLQEKIGIIYNGGVLGLASTQKSWPRRTLILSCTIVIPIITLY